MTVRGRGTMLRAIGRPFFAIVAALLGLAAMSSVAVAAAAVRYDVSYFWSRSFAGVQAYRDRVAVVLGPEVARGLKMVAKGDLSGLVYKRDGGRTRAIRAPHCD